MLICMDLYYVDVYILKKLPFSFPVSTRPVPEGGYVFFGNQRFCHIFAGRNLYKTWQDGFLVTKLRLKPKTKSWFPCGAGNGLTSLRLLKFSLRSVSS